ncbi:MAG: NAD(P)/FAD-dependent oxidoreductase [Candidatus Omnitrophica bacterium]|nr:NAD(P)/FAD-dependent oxidoreductase [Candidatus Omnitrophota bacterium]
MKQKNDYDAIIIGAGIGGLTCGAILAKNNKKVLILEKNSKVGGAVSTFYRKGYPLDISHAMCGLNKGAFIRKVFDYLELTKDIDFVKLEKSFIFKNDMQEFICPADLEQYKYALQSKFPKEKININKLFDEMIHIWTKQILKSYYEPNMCELLTYPFKFSKLVKYRYLTFEKFLNRFTKSTELKEMLSIGWPYLGLDRFSVSALYMICLIMGYYKEGTYFIKGGFGKLIESLVTFIKKNDGKIIIDSEVEEIIKKGKVAVGVKCKDGRSFYGKIIISNVDTVKTFNDLSKNFNLSNGFRRKIKNLRQSTSALQVFLAVKAQIDPTFLSVGSIIIEQKLKSKNFPSQDIKGIDLSSGELIYTLSIHSLKDFTDFKNEDIFMLNVVLLPTDVNFWNSFDKQHKVEQYCKVKQDWIKLVTKEMKSCFKIEEVLFEDILTPISFKSWLNSTDGCIYDLAAYSKQMLLDRMKIKTPVKNLFLVGAKTFPGMGIAGAFCSAVSLSDKILDKKLTNGKFVIN